MAFAGVASFFLCYQPGASSESGEHLIWIIYSWFLKNDIILSLWPLSFVAVKHQKWYRWWLNFQMTFIMQKKKSLDHTRLPFCRRNDISEDSKLRYRTRNFSPGIFLYFSLTFEIIAKQKKERENVILSYNWSRTSITKQKTFVFRCGGNLLDILCCGLLMKKKGEILKKQFKNIRNNSFQLKPNIFCSA